MTVLQFTLNVSAEEYLKFYRGDAADVVTETLTGLTIRFPAQHLQKFVTYEGVQGLFEIEFDKNNRFIRLHKLS